MQVMRQLCTDAHLIHFLFVTYDAREVIVLADVLASLIDGVSPFRTVPFPPSLAEAAARLQSSRVHSRGTASAQPSA